MSTLQTLGKQGQGCTMHLQRPLLSLTSCFFWTGKLTWIFLAAPLSSSAQGKTSKRSKI